MSGPLGFLRWTAWPCLAGLAAASCASPAPRPWVHPTPADWAAATAKLADLRAGGARAPFVVTITTTLRDPRSGRVVDGRGAMAVAPGALRMILVGAAGATLLDAWVTPERWRIAVPPIDYVRRGGAEDPGGLPVGFFRWWFFAPFQGTLFAAAVRRDEVLWLLRRGDAVVELHLGHCGSAGRSLGATRRSDGRAEHVEECRVSARGEPGPGDVVRYVDDSSGLQVDILVESVSNAPADGEAFRDPDAPSTPAH
jgi:hypothetical protein